MITITPGPPTTITWSPARWYTPGTTCCAIYACARLTPYPPGYTWSHRLTLLGRSAIDAVIPLDIDVMLAIWRATHPGTHVHFRVQIDVMCAENIETGSSTVIIP